MKFSEFKYERIDFEDIRREYPALLRKLEECDDPVSFRKIFDDINKYRAHIYTMHTLASVRHTIDTSDKFYDEENEYWDDTSPLIQEYETQFFRICIDCPFRDRLEIPETFFMLGENSLKAFSPKIIEDLQEENRLTTEYGKLKASAKIEFKGEIYNLASIGPLLNDSDRQTRKEAAQAVTKFYEDNEEKFDEIYDKLVKVRDRMAKKLGYRTFTELGYIRMNRFDYDEEMVANYRKQVREDIVPIVSKIHKAQARRIGLDKLEYYDMGYEFRSGNPKPIGEEKVLVDAALKMYTEMSPETGEYFKMMAENELFDLTTKPNKEMGGYCTEILDYKVPFIFSNFNGDEGDVNVLTHEAGHGLQCYLSLKEISIPDIAFPTLETCEIHSMSMEFFAFPWLDLFFGKDTAKYKLLQLSGTLKFLPYGCLVDHFQHEVYNHPEMTPEERKQCWRALEKQYNPDTDYRDFPLLERGGFFYRQGHIFQSPFYYIDYTLAQVCALQFYKRMLDEDPKAFEDYLKICRIGGQYSFLKVVEMAGLTSPFRDGCLKGVAATMDKELDRMNELSYD
ncbi:MAG: M3 family oligoendopeptidase [Erysipelotrichaceae bacterium]|nr:M3 family oligoendopeptidase [Erysipelotrichaceae bacterium]